MTGTPKDGHGVPHGTHDRQSIIAAFGHLAGWAVMYSIGIALVLGHLWGSPIAGLGIVYVGLCAHAGYLFDRVKFRDRDLDPADLMAQPVRHGYLRRSAKWIRVVMWIEWIAAAALGVAHDPWLGALVVGGVVAGYVYSGWKPREDDRGRSRLKDLHGLKAGLVSCSVVGLGVAGVFGFGERGVIDSLMGAADYGWLSALGIWCIVFGDAVVCDLDDVDSDGSFFIRSLPVMMGSRVAGVIAGLMLVVGGVLVTAGGIGMGDIVDRVFFSATVAVSGIGIMRQRQRRDWIDGRMLVIVLLTLWIAG